MDIAEEGVWDRGWEELGSFAGSDSTPSSLQHGLECVQAVHGPEGVGIGYDIGGFVSCWSILLRCCNHQLHAFSNERRISHSDFSSCSYPLPCSGTMLFLSLSLSLSLSLFDCFM